MIRRPPRSTRTDTLSLHDALPISDRPGLDAAGQQLAGNGFLQARQALGVIGFAARHQNVLGVGRSEEHTSELQSLMRISYAVFCLKKKKQSTHINTINTSLSTQRTHTDMIYHTLIKT